MNQIISGANHVISGRNAFEVPGENRDYGDGAPLYKVAAWRGKVRPK